MAEHATSDQLAEEFDLMTRRAGITVPAERRDAVLVAYADLRSQMLLLNGRYSHLDEPSNIFRLAPTEEP
jgi:hypothetical protein